MAKHKYSPKQVARLVYEAAINDHYYLWEETIHIIDAETRSNVIADVVFDLYVKAQNKFKSQIEKDKYEQALYDEIAESIE